MLFFSLIFVFNLYHYHILKLQKRIGGVGHVILQPIRMDGLEVIQSSTLFLVGDFQQKLG